MITKSPKRTLAALVCTLVGLTAASASGAAPGLSKPRYVARANAICAAAEMRVRRLVPLYPIARTAKIGDRWLKSDRQALAALRALKAPASDRSRVARFLKLSDKTVNVGLAAMVKAAKAKRPSAYAAAGSRHSELLLASRAAAASYGMWRCFRW